MKNHDISSEYGKYIMVFLLINYIYLNKEHVQYNILR